VVVAGVVAKVAAKVAAAARAAETVAVVSADPPSKWWVFEPM
jgi:hypothetical protein